MTALFLQPFQLLGLATSAIHRPRDVEVDLVDPFESSGAKLKLYAYSNVAVQMFQPDQLMRFIGRPTCAIFIFIGFPLNIGALEMSTGVSAKTDFCMVSEVPPRRLLHAALTRARNYT